MTNLVPKLEKIKLKPKIYRQLPENPGVYLYFKNNYPIYVGKAINLKKRVASYFRLTLETKTAKMISEAEEISFIKVSNELEALLLEAKLIKQYQPKYNVISKDDKHPLYIILTKEKYPRILTVRKTDLNIIPNKSVWGPFPSSVNVKSVLKMVRRIFPFSDHKIGKRPCIYSQIGLCSPCPNMIELVKNKEDRDKLRGIYLKHIRNLRSLLDGNTGIVRKRLENEMKDLSGKQLFEEAKIVRDQMQKLDYIVAPHSQINLYLENPNLFEDVRRNELIDLKKILKSYSISIPKLTRIECFDVAHLQGASASASMVTFRDGSPDKIYYRHFRIYQKSSQDDYASMREVAERRKKHIKDWGRPDLIIVDGGKGQMSVFFREFENLNIPVVGLAKKFETLVIPVRSLGTTEIKEFRLPKGPALNLVQRIRDEAHRFAQAYHHKLFEKSLFERK